MGHTHLSMIAGDEWLLDGSLACRLLKQDGMPPPRSMVDRSLVLDSCWKEDDVVRRHGPPLLAIAHLARSRWLLIKWAISLL
ncbi:hypothetical protein ACLOJK_018698 [Asimina triloba]